MPGTYAQRLKDFCTWPHHAAERLASGSTKVKKALLCAWQANCPSILRPRATKRLAIASIVQLIKRFTLAPEPLREVEQAMTVLSRIEVARLCAGDPWMTNFLLSLWEYVHGETTLTTYPWNISLPIADICNARCSFCTSWLEGRRMLQLEQLDAFAPVLRHAALVGLIGHGEPLAHPRFPEICERLAALLDERAACYTITNGVFLEKWKDHLETLNVESYSISLNAATPETHHEIMGLGPEAFSKIVDSIRALTRLPGRSGRPRQVHISLVVTQQNIHEVPAFVRLGNSLGVTGIWLRTLLPQGNLIEGLNYHLLPPYLHPRFEQFRSEAVDAIRRSSVPVHGHPETWSHPIFSPRLRKWIEENPPQVVSREEALQDGARRSRFDALYDPSKQRLRGRPRAEGDGTAIEWAGGRLRIRTPAGQWAQAAQIPVTMPKEGVTGVRIDVTLRDLDGRIGLGLMNSAKAQWVDRVIVDAGSPKVISLEGRTGDKDGMVLVVENAREGAASSAVSIDAVRVLLKPQMRECPEAVEWNNLTVNDPLDPLEDGLNPLGRQPRFACKAVYYNLYVNELFFRVSPCCYMTEVPGFEEIRFDGGCDFFEVWNSPAMVELRRRLRDGPLFGACKRCPETW